MLRKILVGVLVVIAAAAVFGLVAVVLGVPIKGADRPMVFARILVVSVGLLIVTLRWRRGIGGKIR